MHEDVEPLGEGAAVDVRPGTFVGKPTSAERFPEPAPNGGGDATKEIEAERRMIDVTERCFKPACGWRLELDGLPCVERAMVEGEPDRAVVLAVPGTQV